MKNCSIQKETDDEKNNNQKGFDKGPEQAWCKGPLYLMLRIDSELKEQQRERAQYADKY